MTELENFLANLLYNGLEYFRKFYGTYLGIVESNKDPEKRGRIQVKVPEVGHRIAPDVWVEPEFDGANTNRGAFFPPEPGDHVKVKFRRGDPGQPSSYKGGWYGKKDLPAELAYSENGFPERRGWVTRSGQSIVFDDESGQESIKIVWHGPGKTDTAYQTDTTRKVTAQRQDATGNPVGDFSSITFNENGFLINTYDGTIISIDSKNSSFAVIDANKNVIATDSNGIKLIDGSGNWVSLSNGTADVVAKTVNIMGGSINLKGGSVFIGDAAALSAVLGEPLVAWLSSHVHSPPIIPVSGTTGPVNPAQVAALPLILSNTVKVRK